MNTAKPSIFACDTCGWRTDRFEDGFECDACGGPLMCIGCWDYPEFCSCEGAEQ